MSAIVLAAAPFAPVDQEYLFEARQMQALSFAVHIPLVCFGIAFPAFVLFMEALWLRTGDPVYRTVAQRWSKVMLALSGVGYGRSHVAALTEGTIVQRRLLDNAPVPVDRELLAELFADSLTCW